MSQNTLMLERKNSDFNKSVMMTEAKRAAKSAVNGGGILGFSKYYQNTKQIINQAKQVLDGEKNFNKGELDRYLLTARAIRPEKKNIRKILPAIHD